MKNNLAKFQAYVVKIMCFMSGRSYSGIWAKNWLLRSFCCVIFVCKYELLYSIIMYSQLPLSLKTNYLFIKVWEIIEILLIN